VGVQGGCAWQGRWGDKVSQLPMSCCQGGKPTAGRGFDSVRALQAPTLQRPALWHLH
jgi:hypothetical protein